MIPLFLSQENVSGGSCGLQGRQGWREREMGYYCTLSLRSFSLTGRKEELGTRLVFAGAVVEVCDGDAIVVVVIWGIFLPAFLSS